MKEHRLLSQREELAAEEALFKALMGLETVSEYRAFFLDLCTPAELQAMKDRWSGTGSGVADLVRHRHSA